MTGMAPVERIKGDGNGVVGDRRGAERDERGVTSACGGSAAWQGMVEAFCLPVSL